MGTDTEPLVEPLMRSHKYWDKLGYQCKLWAVEIQLRLTVERDCCMFDITGDGGASPGRCCPWAAGQCSAPRRSWPDTPAVRSQAALWTGVEEQPSRGPRTAGTPWRSPVAWTRQQVLYGGRMLYIGLVHRKLLGLYSDVYSLSVHNSLICVCLCVIIIILLSLNIC